MRQKLPLLGLVLMASVALGGCAETLVSRAPKNGVVLTTSHQVPAGYDVLGTVHAQSYIWRFFNAPIGPVMTELNDLMAAEAKKLGADAVIGVEYAQTWLTYSASGTAVKIKR